MTSRSTVVCAAISALMLGLWLPRSAAAQMPRLTIVAPAAPGGGWDQTARTMQQALQRGRLARTIQVLNIPGAGGTIGLARFTSSNRGQGDVLMAMGLIMVGAVITNRSPVTLDEVTPIARLTGEYELLVVPAASPFQTLQDFITAWKADPGSLAIAGGSAGGTDHMLAGLLAKAVGMDPTTINYIPHSGGGEASASLIGNQVAAGVNGLNELVPFVRTGRLRALAISSEERLPGLDVPTFLEQGIDLTMANWRGVVAPPGISAEQRATLTTLMDNLAKSAGWQEMLTKNDWIDMYQSGPAFDRYLKEEDARAKTILESIGLAQ